MAIVALVDSGSNYRGLRRAIRGDREIRHVARMRPLLDLQSMMLHIRVQVRTSG